MSKVIYGGGFVFDFAKWLIILAIILAIINYFIISIFVVDGASMDPTMATGQIAILNKITYTISNPNRGDVVVINYPGDPTNKRYVKRVIGLPGEDVKVFGGQVYINGKKLTENYLPSGLYTDKDDDWQLGASDYFTMGDNRPNSNDSRYFGPVEKRFIVGRTDWVIIPKFFSITTPSYIN
ncbi:MAG: signal peptidase I [Candidatus Berkelbacteria bacterium]|nr:signal peptidase I [Candidatus Berkelbacteria bacterium]